MTDGLYIEEVQSDEKTSEHSLSEIKPGASG